MSGEKDISHQLDLMIDYLERKKEIFEFDKDALEDAIWILRGEINDNMEKAEMDFEEWVEKARFPSYWKEEGKDHHFKKRLEWVETSENLARSILALKQIVGADEYDRERNSNRLKKMEDLKESIKRERDQWEASEDETSSSPSQTSAGDDQ